jgi:hypothetical protein
MDRTCGLTNGGIDKAGHDITVYKWESRMPCDCRLIGTRLELRFRGLDRPVTRIKINWPLDAAFENREMPLADQVLQEFFVPIEGFVKGGKVPTALQVDLVYSNETNSIFDLHQSATERWQQLTEEDQTTPLTNFGRRRKRR